MKTVHQICREAGDDCYTNDHVFEWLSKMMADDSVNVRSEFGAAPNESGEYTVTITAYPRKAADHAPT